MQAFPELDSSRGYNLWQLASCSSNISLTTFWYSEFEQLRLDVSTKLVTDFNTSDVTHLLSSFLSKKRDFSETGSISA
jgi:hypothetical protein